MPVCGNPRFIAFCTRFSEDGSELVNDIIDIPLSGQPLQSSQAVDGSPPPRNTAPTRFLAGPENHLAVVAVEAILGTPPNGYNPIVIYGPSGSGKSHLARGLAAEWKSRHRRRRVVYTTAVDFAREVREAVEANAMDDFRDQYRQTALLVVEDVGQLAGKPHSQEELASTIEWLTKNDAWVMVTAAAGPSQLAGLSDRLQGRLMAGLTVPLSFPGQPARRAILQQLATQWEIDLDDTVAGLLADGLPVSVPELGGALMQLMMPTQLDRQVIGEQAIDRQVIDAGAVHQFLALRKTLNRPSLRDIALGAARFFSLNLSDLRGQSRRRNVVTARSVAMYLARTFTEQSLQQIGEYFGGRDHTTVMHSCRKVEGLRNCDPAVRAAVNHLEQAWSVG